MRKTYIAGLAAGTLLATGLAAPAFADSHDNAQLSVLHGVPGLTVDVYVDGDLTLDDFTPGTLAGPLDLPADTYNVVIAAEDSTDDSDPILEADLPLEAGMNYTAVAHLDESGTPMLSLFTNDISGTEAGESRLTVRHTAAAPAVDIWAGGDVLFSNLSNPDEVSGDVPADTYEAAVAAHDTDTVVLGPTDLALGEGVHTIVYAWGSLEEETLDLAVQTIDVGAHSPSEIAAGSQGLAATGNNPALLMVVVLLGIAAAGATARAVAVRR